MKFAVIAPTGQTVRYCRTNYHLALAHLKDNWEYTNFYSRTAVGHLILDNSVMELGTAVDFDFLCDAVDAFIPDELILPDVPLDDKATYKNAVEYAPRFKELYPSMKLMAVPQGDDLVCWMKDYYKYLQVPEVDTIGIPKHRKGMRLNILHEISKDRPSSWDHHLLGTWGDPINELPLVAKKFPWVRGVDSKLPVRLGNLGIAIHPKRGVMVERYQLPEMDMVVAEDLFPILTDHNIQVMREWADGAEGTFGELRLLSAP